MGQSRLKEARNADLIFFSPDPKKRKVLPQLPAALLWAMHDA